MEIEGLWQSADYRRDSKLCRLGNSERKKGKRRGRRMKRCVSILEYAEVDKENDRRQDSRPKELEQLEQRKEERKPERGRGKESILI